MVVNTILIASDCASEKSVTSRTFTTWLSITILSANKYFSLPESTKLLLVFVRILSLLTKKMKFRSPCLYFSRMIAAINNVLPEPVAMLNKICS